MIGEKEEMRAEERATAGGVRSSGELVGTDERGSDGGEPNEGLSGGIIFK